MLSYYFIIYGELKSTIILLSLLHVLIEVCLIFTGFFADGRSEHETLFGEHAAVAV